MNLEVCTGLLGTRTLPDWVSLNVTRHKDDLLYEAFTVASRTDPVGLALVSHKTYDPERFKSSSTSCRFVEIVLLEVKEEFRRQGVAREVMRIISHDFPCENIILACTEDNRPAYSLYTTIGFKILWIDAVDNSPWFIKPSGSEKKSIKEIVNILDDVYSVRCDYMTCLAGLTWKDRQPKST